MWSLDSIETTPKYNYFNYQIYIKLKNLENWVHSNFFYILNLSCQGLKEVLLGYHSPGNSSQEPQSTEDPLDWGAECQGLWGEWISQPTEPMDGAVSVCWVNVGAADTLTAFTALNSLTKLFMKKALYIQNNMFSSYDN